jgi:hypothetical protein
MIGAATALLLEPPMRKMEPLPETAAVPCFRKGLMKNVEAVLGVKLRCYYEIRLLNEYVD